MKPLLLTSIVLFLFLYAGAQQEASLDAINFLAGKWKATRTFRLSATGPWDTSAASSSIIKTLHGKVLEEGLEGTLEGKPFATKTLITYNKFSGKYQRAFIDSEHGTLVDYDGEKAGDSLMFTRDWQYPNGSTVKLRVVYRLISKDVFTVENMRMQNSNTWDVTERAYYKRAK